VTDIPSGWSPPDSQASAAPVPLFPLPNVFLFPRQLMPLHIFEPRYRKMIEDSLDGPGRLVLGTITGPGESEAPPPEVMPIAGLGEIARHEKLPDGRFLVWIFGLARVRIAEVDSDEQYRQVQYEIIEEVGPTGSEVRDLRESLSEAILSRTEEIMNLPEDVPIGLLADLLLQRMKLPQEVMEGIFGEYIEPDRATKALEAHARYPAAPEDDNDDED
jgi:Lon protease-like protein